MKPGAIVGAVLARSWRAECPLPLPVGVISADLTAVQPLLLRGGAGALAAHRCAALGLSIPPEWAEARDLHRLRGRLRERETARVFREFEAAGISSLLLKGWSAARHYADPLLRPSGDIDLAVHPADWDAAQPLVLREGRPIPLDVQAGPPAYLERSFEELWDRSQVLACQEVPVRVLGPEDELRLLSLHFWKHFAWRPLWLVDVAAAVEARPRAFDWDCCLAGSPRSSEWVQAAVLLAGALLGADMVRVPFSHRGADLPPWLLVGVRAQWELDAAQMMDAWSRPLRSMVRENLGRPAKLLAELGRRFRDPVRATVERGGPFDRGPRLPVQIIATLAAARAGWRRPPILPPDPPDQQTRAPEETG